MDSVSIEQVVAILEDDAFRRGGAVPYDRILSVCAKHHLPPQSIALIKDRLQERDVFIEMPDNADDVAPDDSGQGERPSVSNGGGDGDPSEGAAPEAVRDILASYYSSASQFRRLSAQEELSLARRIHAGRAAEQQLAMKVPADLEGLSNLVSDGRRARDTLIEANLFLVPFVAKSIEGRDKLPPEDLIQEGNIGLMRAVERFEGGHEAKFSTYACWWIWSFMKRGLIDRGRLVRLPVHVADRIPGLLRARRALTREHDGVPPTVTELAEHLRWRVEHVIFAIQSLEDPISIDAPTGDGLHSIGERLPGAPEDQPDAAAARRQEQRLLTKLVESLGKEVSFVLRERFGLGDQPPRTLEEIGEQIGVTRERVRQIEAKGLKKLRHPSRRRFWALFGVSTTNEVTPRSDIKSEDDE